MGKGGGKSPRGSTASEPQPSLLLPGPCGAGAARSGEYMPRGLPLLPRRCSGSGPCSSLWLWRALALLLLAAVLGLALGLTLLLAGAVTETETTAATVMAGKHRPCPEDGTWYRNHSYYFSKEMQNWNSSGKFCWLHNATLAVIKERSALDTIYSNKGKENHWIGLRKETEGWRWVDGLPFINDINGPYHYIRSINDDAAAERWEETKWRTSNFAFYSMGFSCILYIKCPT